MLQKLAEDLLKRGKLDLSETFIDGTHAGAKKGSSRGKTRRGPATKIMAIADRRGLPISATIASGQRHEVALVEGTLEARFTKRKPKRLIGDRACDSAKLEATLAQKKSS